MLVVVEPKEVTDVNGDDSFVQRESVEFDEFGPEELVDEPETLREDVVISEGIDATRGHPVSCAAAERPFGSTNSQATFMPLLSPGSCAFSFPLKIP